MNKCQKLCPIHCLKLLLIDQKATPHETVPEQWLYKLQHCSTHPTSLPPPAERDLILGFLMQCNIEVLEYNTFISQQHLFTLHQQVRKCNIIYKQILCCFISKKKKKMVCRFQPL